jgi:hypothetical protein
MEGYNGECAGVNYGSCQRRVAGTPRKTPKIQKACFHGVSRRLGASALETPIRRPVTISEPTTLITDYLLGTLSELCAILLIRRNTALRQRSIQWWAFALFAAALGSYVGGTYHGFRHALDPAVATVLWKVTTISMGVASFFLLTAAITAAFTGQDRRWLIAGAALKLAIYVGWMLGHDEFRFVIYDYGSTLAILLLLVVAERTRGVEGHRAYIATGILVSIAAAVVQQSGFRLHQHFNHNDLMHVIQMGGVWLLYEGGARLRDAGGPDGPES